MSIVGPLLPHEMDAAPQLDESLASLLPGVQPEFQWQAALSKELWLIYALQCKVLIMRHTGLPVHFLW